MSERKLVSLAMLFCMTVSVFAQMETELKPQGLVLPRPATGAPQTGMIRYNTLHESFEGFDGIDWISFGAQEKQLQLILSTSDFQPLNHADEFTRSRNALFYDAGVSDPVFVGHFSIPVGASLDSVTLVVKDNSTKNVSLQLRRYFAQYPGLDLEDVFDPLTSSGNLANFRPFTSTSVSGTGIKDYSFSVELTSVDAMGDQTSWPGDQLTVHKVVVDYSLP